MKRVSSFACVYLFVTCLALPFASLADGLVLTWNGARGAAWDDSSTANWLDNGNNAVAWTDGATAVFPAGAFVEIKGTVKPTSIRFSGDGATLAGSGRILLSNSVSGNVGTTNSITALVVGDASFEKLGAGTLAVSFAKGAVEVKEGALLLAGSRCANLCVSAASGATVELLGEASSAGNLLGNGSFEDTPITAANGYPYMIWDSLRCGGD